MSEMVAVAESLDLFLGPYTFGAHVFSVGGGAMPVAEVQLAGPQPVLFSAQSLLWRQPGLPISPGPARPRSVTGEPVGALAEIAGAGRAAFAARQAGRAFMLFLPPRQGIDVRGCRFLCGVGLTYAELPGAEPFTLERFSAGESPGLLVLQAAGEVFEVLLRTDDACDLSSHAILYKDTSVRLQRAAAAPSSDAETVPVRCLGPGVLAIETGGVA